MSERRQRPIPVTSSERARLEQAKQKYEKVAGREGDWGSFLGTIALLGLAAIGIYALAKMVKRADQTVTVRCPMQRCGLEFLIAIPENSPAAFQVRCPHCQADLVVNMAS